MLFRRRFPPSLKERLRVALWPRRNWARSMRYFGYRLWRMSGSPHRVAAGFAAGVFAIATPFLGFQMMLGALLAVLLRGSIAASALGSFMGNPFTYPLIWISTYTLGNALLGQAGQASHLDFERKGEAVWHGIKTMSYDMLTSALEAFWPILKPMTVGALPVGVAAAGLSYIFVRRLVESARHDRLLSRFQSSQGRAAQFDTSFGIKRR